MDAGLPYLGSAGGRGLAILVYVPQIFLVPRLQGAINRLSRRRTILQRTIGQNLSKWERWNYGSSNTASACADFGKPNVSYPIRIYKFKYALRPFLLLDPAALVSKRSISSQFRLVSFLVHQIHVPLKTSFKETGGDCHLTPRMVPPLCSNKRLDGTA